jgi:hypothetical protein
LAAAALLMQGCATKPVLYGPIGPDVPYGYKDHPNADGGFTVLVDMPGTSAPAELRAFFDRRAAELCPAGVDRTNVFKMQHSDYTAVNYGSQYPSVASRVWTGSELEGYVYCKPGAAAPAEAAAAP